MKSGITTGNLTSYTVKATLGDEVIRCIVFDPMVACFKCSQFFYRYPKHEVTMKVNNIERKSP
jgi:hypothetical protein